MKILVDEHVPAITARSLRDMGHDVQDVRGMAGAGASDREIWQLARQEERLLTTTDKGFASRGHESHWGMLVARLRQPNRLRIHERVLRAMARFEPSEWPDRLVVVRDVATSTWPPEARTE